MSAPRSRGGPAQGDRRTLSRSVAAGGLAHKFGSSAAIPARCFSPSRYRRTSPANFASSHNDAPYEVTPALANGDPQLAGQFAKGQPASEERSAYEQRMKVLLDDRENRSSARYLHYAVVFVVSLQMLLTVFVVIFIAQHPALSSLSRQLPQLQS